MTTPPPGGASPDPDGAGPPGSPYSGAPSARPSAPPRGGPAARLRVRLHRAPLRARILTGVLAVTLVVLACFGFATVTVLHGYLLSRTDSDLQTALTVYQSLLQKGDAAGHRASHAGTGTAHSGSPGTVHSGAPGTVRSSTPGGPGTVHSGTPGKNSSGPAQGPSQVTRDPAPFREPSALDHYYIEFLAPGTPPRAFVHGNDSLIPQLPVDLAAAGGRGQTVTSRNGRTQLRLFAETTNGRTLVATTSLDTLNSTVSQMTAITALGMLAAAILIFAGVSLVIRRGLRPVQSMAAAADRITAGDLDSRVSPEDDPATEVGRLGTALNGMLARIHNAVREREASEQNARQFFADASHELRTPLAALRANAELYQQGALPERGQVDQAMDRIADQARRMGTLVDDMLRLARLDQHPQWQHQPVDLSALAAASASRAAATSPARTWRTRITPGITIDGDEEMLRRAVDNLLANINVHTPEGTTATLTVAAPGNGTVVIDVTDDGPGVPPDKLPRIFDRFYRAPGKEKRPGSGLGLAIAAAAAAAHHGTATATAAHPHGLRITITIPASQQTRQPDSGPRLTDS